MILWGCARVWKAGVWCTLSVQYYIRAKIGLRKTSTARNITWILAERDMQSVSTKAPSAVFFSYRTCVCVCVWGTERLEIF